MSLKNSKLLQENEDLTMKLETANQRASDLEHSVDELTMAIQSLKNDLSDKTLECRRDQELLKQSREEKISMEEKSEMLINHNRSLQKQTESLNINTGKLTKQLENSECVNKNINIKCKKLEQEVKKLNDTILEDKVTFPTRVKESEAYVALQNTVFQLQDQIKTLKQNLELQTESEM